MDQIRVASGSSSPGESNSDGFVDVQEDLVNNTKPATLDHIIKGDTVEENRNVATTLPHVLQNIVDEAANAHVASPIGEVPKYSTPVRTTPPLVDGRTISRPKKGAPIPILSPILSDAEIVRRMNLTKDVDNEGGTEAQTNTKHNSTFGVEKNESALAAPNEATAFNEDKANGTFNMTTTPAATSSPVDKNNIVKRARQQTTIIQSVNSQMVKQVFASLRETADHDDAERKMLALVAKIEQECTGKMENQQAAMKKQLEANATVASLHRVHIRDLLNSLKRIPQDGLTKTVPADDSVDKAAFESLRKEYKQLEDEYISVRDMYKQLFECKNLIENRSALYRESMEDHKKKEEEIKRCYKAMSDRYDRLRVDAQQKITAANEMIAALQKKQIDETQHIKMALRQKETALLAAQNQLKLKTEEAAELHKICDTLVAAQETNSIDGSEYEA